MGLIYDIEKFREFKKLSVQDVSELEIGQTYYSNTWPTEFTVRELLTYGQLDDRLGHERHPNHDMIAWIVYGPEKDDYCSLADRNVGNSYNPWMIFKDKETRDRCEREMPVTYDSSDDFWEYDDPWEMRDNAWEENDFDNEDY